MKSRSKGSMHIKDQSEFKKQKNQQHKNIQSEVME